MINRIPIGGLAHAKPDPAALTRAQWILFVTGGLLVNAAMVLVALALLPEGGITDSSGTILEAFIWSNVIVIASNLVPHETQTGFGPLATDGKLLFDAIFNWKRPQSTDDRIPPWAVWTARVLKVFIVVLLGICTILLAGLCCFVLFVHAAGSRRPGSVLVGLFIGACAGFLGYYTWRVIRQPVATKRKAPSITVLNLEWLNELFRAYPSAASSDLIANLQNQLVSGEHQKIIIETEKLLSTFPDDIALLAWRAVASEANDHARAEQSWDRILAQLTPDEAAIYAGAYGQKLIQIIFQKDLTRFNDSIRDFLALPLPDSLKVFHLDQVASAVLYFDIREMLPPAEFCIRKALELAPGKLTLQGTLGGLLAESREFDEAEPCLRACYDRSPALHDHGIAGFYLALIAEHRGDLKAAKTLARQSLILHSEPWLTKKAGALFARLKQRKS